LQTTAEAETMASLVTIYWWFGRSPAIYYMDGPKNYNALKGANGHTMVFAAYDPEHYSGDVHTPWVSSTRGSRKGWGFLDGR